jgi:hypothetical protein
MAVLTPSPKMQFTTAAGVPLSGGKVYTYLAGTTTPLATYTDYAGGTPNSNPIILDSRGEANIWLGSALYKFRLTDSNDVEIWTVDYISAPTSAVSPILSGNVTIDSDTPTPALKITQTGSGPVLRVQDSADPDATPFIIDNTGNVGLGTLTPAQKLDVFDGVIRVGGAVQGKVLGYSSSNVYTMDLGVSVGTGAAADVGLFNRAVGNAVFGTSNTERMRIDSSGNVGVGTNAPTALMHLYNASSATFQITGDSNTNVVSSRASTDAVGANFNFRKYRGSQAGPTTVASADQVGQINYSAYDGTALRNLAQIIGFVETYTTTDNVSSYLAFYTRPTGVAAAATERMRITANGDLWFNSGYGSAAAAYGCRAWVNFNGTTSPGTIRASGNVTSVTKNGTGNYTINFTNAMPDANYAVAGTASAGTNYPAWGIATAHNVAPTTSNVTVYCGATGGSTVLGYNADSAYVSISIFR